MSEETTVDGRVPMPDSTRQAFARAFQRVTKELYTERADNQSYSVIIQKELSAAIADTAQGISVGVKAHPFNFKAVAELKNSNIHHNKCLRTKASCTVGLGFITEENKARREAGLPLMPQKDSKVSKELNDLCDVSFQSTLKPIALDFWEFGGGLLEVKRKKPTRTSPVIGLHFLPAPDAKVEVTNKNGTRHWNVRGKDTNDERKFALFGDIDSFMRRNPSQKNVSEIIYFPQPTNASRWYGYPGYLAAVAAMELTQCLYQREFDFNLNRGVPEFMLFFIGAKLDPKDWKKIEDTLNANIGLGNSHKTMAINLTGTDVSNMKVQLEKLAVESKVGDTFSTMSDALGLSIVSAHGVPPLLAGIQTPGKIGASNELPNAIMGFHLLEIAEAQFLFQQTLGTTLGNPKLNGGLNLRMKDFELNQITDAMDLGLMATIGGMRQTMPEAKAQGRDLGAGLKQ